jgi:hypothetical protein
MADRDRFSMSARLSAAGGGSTSSALAELDAEVARRLAQSGASGASGAAARMSRASASQDPVIASALRHVMQPAPMPARGPSPRRGPSPPRRVPGASTAAAPAAAAPKPPAPASAAAQYYPPSSEQRRVSAPGSVGSMDALVQARFFIFLPLRRLSQLAERPWEGRRGEGAALFA